MQTLQWTCEGCRKTRKFYLIADAKSNPETCVDAMERSHKRESPECGHMPEYVGTPPAPGDMDIKSRRIINGQYTK